MTSTHGLIRTATGTVGLAALTAATWWAWLGWDTEHDVDPTSGEVSGPYQAWQVIGCVCCLGVLAVVGALLLRPWIAAPIVTLVFTGCWAAAAANTDDSGLWAVGAILVLLGTAAGSTALGTVAWRARHRRTRPAA